MNARNIVYIKKFNSSKGIKLANDKIKTKLFLSERNIPVPKTYAVIKDKQELFDFDFSKIENSSFVIKPSRGSKGNGIIIAKFLGENKDFLPNNPKKFLSIFNQKIIAHNYIYQIGDKQVDEYFLKRQLLDIIDGKYSISNGPDQVLIEEKLIPGEMFSTFCNHGLADIRVIVFNLVPVAAMVRMPTQQSNGKANLAQGGIGIGLEVGSGNIETIYNNRKVYIKQFPSEFKNIQGKKIPFWNDILDYSSKIQYFVNLGYLALDWVITNDGPKLLEINARAGLELQNVCGLNLKARLDKIGDLRITDPEKGVEICKTLFSKSKNEINISKVIYLSQQGKLTIKSTQGVSKYNIKVDVDLVNEGNYMSSNLYKLIGKDNSMSFEINDNILNDLKYQELETLPDNNIVLGRNTVSNFFLIAVNKFEDNNIHFLKINNKYLDELKIIDIEISKLNKRVSLSSSLNPINYIEQFDNFITWRGHYEPKFKYSRLDDKKFNDLNTETNRLRDKIGSIKDGDNILNLFIEKLNEIEIKILLINSYKNKKVNEIQKYNELLFGKINNTLLEISKEKIFKGELSKKDLGNKIPVGKVKNYVDNYLKSIGINDVEVVLTSSKFSRVSVIYGKTIKISVSQNETYFDNELDGILAHEIDTHLVRYLNGMKSGWNILKDGTGFYLKDEEGLAIYNSLLKLPQGYESLNIYKRYFLISEGFGYGFSKLFDLVKFLYPDKNMEGCFKTLLRIKKGVENYDDIGIGTVYMKDKVYLEGYEHIKKWIESGGDVGKMYKGKYKIQDLDFIC